MGWLQNYRAKRKAEKEIEGSKSKLNDWVMRNTLTLTMVDGKRHEWTQEDWKGKNRIVPW